MEENKKKMEEHKGLVPERFGCRYCERSFKSQPSRSNHHKRKHANKHAYMKKHKNFLIKFANIAMLDLESDSPNGIINKDFCATYRF